MKPDYNEKLYFAHIFDLKAQFLIIKAIKVRRYRPRIELSVSNDKVMVFIYNYINNYIPDVHVKHKRKTILTIDDNKNCLPILLHIKDYILFNQEEVFHLTGFIYHRTSLNKKRYDVIDEKFYKVIEELNKQ